jgi:hypothetical protein
MSLRLFVVVLIAFSSKRLAALHGRQNEFRRCHQAGQALAATNRLKSSHLPVVRQVVFSPQQRYHN